MTAKEFTHHLYQNIWKYIIEEKEFDDYWSTEEYPEYTPDDFISSTIPDLIHSLKENFPFYETYKKVVGSIDSSERQLIVEFMIWFRTYENKTGNDIYNEMQHRGVELKPLDNLARFVETTTLPDIVISSIGQDNKLDLLFKTIEKFTSASKSLTNRRKGKPNIQIEDEYDIQDILQAILKPHFPTIKIEEVVPGNDAEKFLKIDFVLSNIKVAIECKCIRDKNHAKKLTKEINDDIQTYHKHSHCSHLVFFIYDKDLLITSPDTLEENYSKKQIFDTKEMTIDLRIRPKN